VRPCSQPYAREDDIERQVTANLARLALHPELADSVLKDLETEKSTERRARQETVKGVREKLRVVNERLGRLMAAYLAGALFLDEYQQAKKELIDERHGIEDQIVTLEKGRFSWLEPAINFVSLAKQAGSLTKTEDKPTQRDFLKKAGSNLTISDRRLTVTPREAWELVVDQGHFAQHNAATGLPAAAFLGETDLNLIKLGN